MKPAPLATATLTACLALSTAPAHAASIAYLSRTGSGAACTQSAPCNNADQAISVAGAGGTVVCLDRGDYSGAAFVNITTSILISCGDGLWQGHGTVLQINPPAGSSVLIEGFVSDGITTINSIEYTGQGTLKLSRVRMSNNVMSTSGLNFAPTGSATLHVSDSVFYNMSGSGVLIRPTGSGTANVHISNVKLERSANGLFVDGGGGPASINVSLSNSLVASNVGSGIVTNSSASAEIRVMLDGVKLGGNGIGVNSNGPRSNVIIGRSMVTENQVGFATAGGGRIFSYGTNQINANNNDNVNVSTLISQN